MGCEGHSSNYWMKQYLGIKKTHTEKNKILEYKKYTVVLFCIEESFSPFPNLVKNVTNVKKILSYKVF